MAKTKIDSSVLKTLHRVLRQQTDLKDRINRGPRRTKAASNAEKQTAEELDAAKAIVTKTKMAVDEKQLLLKQREDRIEDLNGKRNACDSNKEYQLLNDQIAADEAANSVLSDEILETLEKIDELEAAVAKKKEELGKANKETERVKGEVAASLSLVNADLELVEKELAETEAKLPSEVKVDYRRLIAANGENALAKVEENCCGNCYTMLSPQVLDQLRMQIALFCSSCGSILYATEDSHIKN